MNRYGMEARLFLISSIKVTGLPPKAPLGSVKVTTNADHFQNPEDVYQAKMRQYDLQDQILEKMAENTKKEPLDIKLGI